MKGSDYQCCIHHCHIKKPRQEKGIQLEIDRLNHCACIVACLLSSQCSFCITRILVDLEVMGYTQRLVYQY